MPEYILDTSALLSLHAGGILETVLESSVRSTASVEQELHAFAQHTDTLGQLAKNILTLPITFEEVLIKGSIHHVSKTDNDLVILTQQTKGILITDDAKIARHTDTNIQIFFSPFFLSKFVKQKRLTNEKAIEILEKMRIIRNWQTNIIYLTAKEELKRQ